MRVVFDGAADDGYQLFGLIPADLGTASVVIESGCRFDAINTLAPLHIVHIELQLAVFTHQGFHYHRGLDFQVFAKVITVCGQKNGTCKLVADGAGAIADFAGFFVSLPGGFYLAEFKTKVFVIVAIFQGDHHPDCRGRDVFQSDKAAFVPIIAANKVALQDEGSDGWIDEVVQDSEKGYDYPKCQMAEKDKADDPDKPGSFLTAFTL